MPLRFPRLPEGTSKGVSESLIHKVIKQINKSYAKVSPDGVISLLGNSIFSQSRAYIPSGVLPVDCIVCYGMGWPVGIVEIYGPEASGKTALVEKSLAEAQKLGYYTCIFSPEYSLNYRRIRAAGVDETKLISFDEAETIEDFYAHLKSTVYSIRDSDKTTPIVVGWDSIASTPTRAELDEEKGLEKSDMGLMGQQMSRFFRRLVRFLFINNVCLLCTNQTRANFSPYGARETTYGGRAIKFYAWVRCRVSPGQPIEKGGEKVGLMCNLKVVKNKVAPPLKECALPIYWTKGIDSAMAVWEYAIDIGLIKRKGATYRYKGGVVTRNTFPKFYANNQHEIDKALRRITVAMDSEEI